MFFVSTSSQLKRKSPLEPSLHAIHSQPFFHSSTPHPRGLPVLDETDILTLFPETLTTEVEAIFANKTGRMCADAAGSRTFAELARPTVPDTFV